MHTIENARPQRAGTTDGGHVHVSRAQRCADAGDTNRAGTGGPSRLVFGMAEPRDDAELRAFGRGHDMPGMVRFAFEREPDYFAALCVEGRTTEVLTCRDAASGRIVAVGHRSVKSAFVNGRPMAVGYLSGLRLHPTVRSSTLLARGYSLLRQRHADGQTSVYVTTVMEGNDGARRILESGRCGLPRYRDLGRFCCVALGLRQQHARRGAAPGVEVRPATIQDGPAIIAFLRREGARRQFFPEYGIEDFGSPTGLLPGLAWDDLLLALRDGALHGLLAAWDQRGFRRWRVTGYAPWLRGLRPALNVLARARGMPLLPCVGAQAECLVLALPCVAGNDVSILTALIDETAARVRGRCAFLLAGLHEHDPLLPALTARPHVSLPSRLYAVAWDDGLSDVERLDPRVVPYLELGGL